MAYATTTQLNAEIAARKAADAANAAAIAALLKRIAALEKPVAAAFASASFTPAFKVG